MWKKNNLNFNLNLSIIDSWNVLTTRKIELSIYSWKLANRDSAGYIRPFFNCCTSFSSLQNLLCRIVFPIYFKYCIHHGFENLCTRDTTWKDPAEEMGGDVQQIAMGALLRITVLGLMHIYSYWNRGSTDIFCQTTPNTYFTCWIREYELKQSHSHSWGNF